MRILDASSGIDLRRGESALGLYAVPWTSSQQGTYTALIWPDGVQDPMSFELEMEISREFTEMGG